MVGQKWTHRNIKTVIQQVFVMTKLEGKDHGALTDSYCVCGGAEKMYWSYTDK